MLASGEWLAGHLADPSLVILHVGSQKDYDAGHIPGARLVTLADISITDATGLRLELPPVAALEEAFGKLGVSDTSRVIVYAGTESVQSATRVWFTLDYLGAGDRATLLDGGLAAWRAEGRPVSTEAAAAQPRKFTAHAAPQRVVNADWVRSHLDDAKVHIIDARLPEFFDGVNGGGMPRAGHIPGARSVPYSSLLGEHGKLKPAESLAPAVNGDVVSYCHIGQQATVVYFAARYLGLDARLYDGSFQDWSRRTDLPVEGDRGGDIDAIFSKLSGVAVLVRRNGHTLFQRGYGEGIDSHTNFRLASFTKQFTAMATMLLVHDGKLRYEARLTDVFPEFPAYGRTITVRHLLTHTSGLPDYEDLMPAGKWTATHQIQDREVLDLLEHQNAGKFSAGANWAYSNSGYVVLGLIVAKVSGMPFQRFLHDRIFEPLHMTNTLAFVNGEDTVPNRAYGHPNDQSSTSATLGDGGVYSNLEDLAKWDEALEKHTLLSEAEMKPALTPVRLADGSATYWPKAPNDDNLAPGKPVAYGFGWFLDPYNGHARMWHSGSTSGFRTVIEHFPADHMTVIILANRTDVEPDKLALEVWGRL
jgi:CubicO group peptidase (beta-lactamase class C family)/3-mercaptopyruvate sulfurtransferase SseA